MIEFIHCGDLHLGCNPNRIEERYEDFFVAFNNLIDYAINKNVRLILVSGDFFHLKVINSKTLIKTIESLNRAKENKIEVIVIEGNHDQAFYVDEDSWLYFLNKQKYLKLLQNEIIDGKIKLKLFDDETGNIIETDDYRIIGLGYLGGMTEKYINDLASLIEKKHKPTVLMMHAAINRLYGQDMGDVKSEVILKLVDKIDYIALGHIHNRYEIDDFIFNPGALENIRLRDSKSGGEKGFYHVKITREEKEVKYILSKPRKVLYENLDLSKIKLPEKALEIIKETKFDLNSGDMLELNLYGQVDFNPYLIDIDKIKTSLQDKYDLLYLEVNNYINLETKAGEKSEIDLENIVEELIVEEIKVNYPEAKRPKHLANLMINLVDKITEDADEKTIIQMLYEEEKSI